MPMATPCPLCAASASTRFASVGERRYWRCGACALVYLEPAQRPDTAAELAEYLLHENDPVDPGYRRFLAPLAEALLTRLPAGARGLDYGCGPGPALPAMLAEHGLQTVLYDPFFAPDEAALSRDYDFILCSEVAEHFHRPGEEFARLAGLLRPGGWLGVMTNLLQETTDFAGWHYRRDPTHVVFYTPATMHWLAARHGWSLVRPSPRVSLFRRSEPAAGGDV